MASMRRPMTFEAAPGIPMDPAPPPAFETPDPAPPPASAGFDWREMDTAPHNRPIYLSADPEDPGTLAYWRLTRQKVRPGRGWAEKSFWASVLTRRALDYVPFCWREASGGAALAAALDRERAVREAVEFQQAKLRETLAAAGVEDAA